MGSGIAGAVEQPPVAGGTAPFALTFETQPFAVRLGRWRKGINKHQCPMTNDQ